MTEIKFEVKRYSIMLGQHVPVPHKYYDKLPMQATIECFGNEEARVYREKLTIYFLPDQLSPTRALTNLSDFGGAIFVNFKDISPYIDILRNETPVIAYVNDEEPELNRIFVGRVRERREVLKKSAAKK